MKKVSLKLIIFLIIFQWNGDNTSFGKNKIETHNVMKLKRYGWEIVEKQSLIESRPGLRPYQYMKRKVQVVKFKLYKNTNLIFCILEYDSQLDTIREACDRLSENIKKKLAE